MARERGLIFRELGKFYIVHCLQRRVLTPPHESGLLYLVQTTPKPRKSLIEHNCREFERKMGMRFSDPSLLHTALTHSSFSNESNVGCQSNERLEYLGDSVLALIVNEYLFGLFPNYDEGELAKIKSNVVSEYSLVAIARQIGIGNYIFLSKGEELSGGRKRDSILADAVEALLAALYLDKGIESVKTFILPYLQVLIAKADGNFGYKKDYKSHLQEIIQKKYNIIPSYEIVQETGPDHLKTFVSRVIIQGVVSGSGQGSTKKKAEQNAAKEALASGEF